MDTSDAIDITEPAKAPPLKFTVRQIECFLAVAETGSFSKAAQTIRASDSAVADSITAMEHALGVELFRRQRSRGATMTSDGLTILPLARRIATDGAELMASLGHHSQSIVGPVRIGIVNTLASMTLPHLIVEVEREHPGVLLEYRTGDVNSLLDAAERAELDLIITFNLGVPPEYERRVLGATEAMVVVSDDHPLATRDHVSLSEFTEERMVMLDIVASRTYTLELMSSQGITPHVAHRTPDYELCRSLVGRGLGYSLLMRRNVTLHTWDGGQVAYLPIEPSPRPIDVLVIWPQNPIPPRVKAVIECTMTLSTNIQEILG